MNYQAFLIKYGEIAVKGKNRHIFEDTLLSQIQNALRRVEGEFHVSKENGRMYVEALSTYDYEELMDACKQFESYFLEQVFKEMWKTTELGDEEQNSSSEKLVDLFGENMIQELASESTENNSLGLAQMLYEQMKRNLSE